MSHSTDWVTMNMPILEISKQTPKELKLVNKSMIELGREFQLPNAQLLCLNSVAVSRNASKNTTIAFSFHHHLQFLIYFLVSVLPDLSPAQQNYFYHKRE